MHLPSWATTLLARLVRRVTDRRPPDFVISPGPAPYLNRWYLIPRNRWFNAYAHEILRSDDDRALHDHPWVNLSIVLEGGYVEHVGDAQGRPVEAVTRLPGDMVGRRPTASHRLELQPSSRGLKPCRTLFLTGPNVRTWGFWCSWGWRPWQDFTDGPKGAGIGKGCE